MFWGTLSDYIGRRTAFQATVGLFAVFTGLVAVSWNIVSLATFRFLSNFGLGGEVPVTLTLASEFSPGRIRGSMAGNIMAAFPVGLVIAAALSLFIIPRWGWRALFLVGVVPAVLLFFVRRYMPESVRYLLSKGHVNEAEKTVEEIERRATGRALSPEEMTTLANIRPEVGVETKVTVFELLAPGRLRNTLLLWVVSFGFLWASNGILFMLPTNPAASRNSAHPGNQLSARPGDRGGVRLFGLRFPDRPLRPPAGSLLVLFRRCVFSSLVRHGFRHVAVCRRGGRRLG